MRPLLPQFLPYDDVRAQVEPGCRHPLRRNPIVAAAEKAGVDYLITLDKRHLLNKKAEIEPHSD